MATEEQIFLPQQPELERITFTPEGSLYPCFPHNDQSRSIGVNPLAKDLPMPYRRLSKLLKSLEPSCNAVTRGAAVFASGLTYSYSLFTAFFISPTILVTSRHNLYDLHQAKAKFVLLWSNPTDCMVLLKNIQDTPWYADIIYEGPVGNSLKEPESGRPVQNHDFVFLQVANEFRHSFYLFPSVKRVAPKDTVFTIQFNGDISESFIKMHTDIPASLHLSEGKLNKHLYTNSRSVSMGDVKAVNNEVVSYTCTTTPGSSGGPVLALSDQAGSFYAIHQGGTFADEKGKSTFAPGVGNHGLLVSDPEFLSAYGKYVVPDFARCGVALPEFVKSLLK